MKRTLVIGLNGGVGEATARLLISLGHKVTGTVRSTNQLAEIKQRLPNLEDAFTLDLANAGEARETLAERCNRTNVDGVIVCAAVSGFGPLETASLSKFRQFLEINTVSHLGVYQACLPGLRKTGGRLVLISSHSGVVALPFLGLYQASKFALEGLADTMRQEAAGFGVKVVLVQPGGIDTKMTRRMKEDIHQAIAALPEDQDQLYGRFYRQFLGRVEGAANLPSGEEVAQVVVKAYTDPDPAPRYRVGDDTEFLLTKRRELSDREMDNLIAQL